MSGALVKISYRKWEFKPPKTIDAATFESLKKVLSIDPELDLAPSATKEFIFTFRVELGFIAAAGVISIFSQRLEWFPHGIPGVLFFILNLFALFFFVQVLLSFPSFISYRATLRTYYRMLKNDVLEFDSYDLFYEQFYPKVLYGKYIRWM